MISASTTLCMYVTQACTAVTAGHQLCSCNPAACCMQKCVRCASCCNMPNAQAIDAVEGSSEQANVALQLASAVIRLGAAKQDATALGWASGTGDVVASTALLLLRTQPPAAEATLAAWLTCPPLELRLTWPRRVPICPHGCAETLRTMWSPSFAWLRARQACCGA